MIRLDPQAAPRRDAAADAPGRKTPRIPLPVLFALLVAGCASAPPPRPAPEPAQVRTEAPAPVPLRDPASPEPPPVSEAQPPNPGSLVALPPATGPQWQQTPRTAAAGRSASRSAPKQAPPDPDRALAVSMQPQRPIGPDLPVINPYLPPLDERPEAERRSLVLHLASQRFEYQEDDRMVHAGPLSSGRPGFDTPKGQYRVGDKNKDKVSGSYDNQLGMDAWMPWAVQIAGPYWLHEGWLPGYPDSHGCVRVGEKDAKFFFANLKRGDPITVTD